MLTLPRTPEVIRFGRFEGTPFAELPFSYLRWLSRKARHPHARLLADCELTRRAVIREAERAALWPLPSAPPRSVCGVELDRHEAAAFAEAERLGRVERPWLPLASAFWDAWHRHAKGGAA